MRYFFLLLLIVASIGIFIAIIIPRYDVVKTQRTDIASYQANLDTAKQLQQSRDSLIAQYNNISQTDLSNLQTLLPDSVNNIRLIIQIDSLATKNNLSSLRNVDYSPDQIAAATPGTAGATTTAAATTDAATANKPYGQFVMSFQTSGSYANFLSFLSDLEQNLRLVDITDIEFTPDTAVGTQTAGSTIDYKVTIQTYWLKK